MALIFVDVLAPCNLEVKAGSLVYICVKDDFIPKTTDGMGLLLGTVITSWKQTLLKQTLHYPDCTVPAADPCIPVDSACIPAPTCADHCIYQISVNDTQIITNPATGLKWELGCGDIKELFPYGCTAAKLINALLDQADWTINVEGITFEADCGTQAQVYTIPIWDRVNETNQGSFQLTFMSTGVLPNYGAGTITVFQGACDDEDPLVIDVCQLIQTCFDQDTIQPDGNGKLAAAAAGGSQLTTIATSGNCFGGIGATFAVRQVDINGDGTILTVDGAPEHLSLHTSSLRNTDVEVTISSPDGTVLAGTTIANHLTVNNPSVCRNLVWTAIPRSQLGVSPIAAGTYAGIIMQTIVDGGAAVNSASYSRTTVAGGERHTVGFPDPLTGSIGPSGTVVFGTRAVSFSDGAGNAGRYSFPDINFIGTTT